MGNGMNKVLPGLYVGNIKDSTDREQLDKNHITHVLSIHDNATPALKDMKYLCIQVSDTPNQNLSQHFRNCIKFIHRARLGGGAVLVHCLAGVSRSVTVSVAYITAVTKHDWRVCLDAVRLSRTVANPNYGFQKQLQEYQEKQLEKERKWIHEHGRPNQADHDFIANLHREHKQASVHQPYGVVGTNPSISRASGSYAAVDAPVNKPGDVHPLGSTASSSGQRNNPRGGAVFENKF